MPKLFNWQVCDICNDCGSSIPAQAAFCIQCGAAQLPPGRPGAPATGTTQPLTPLAPPHVPRRRRMIGWEQIQTVFLWCMVLILVVNVMVPLLLPQPGPIFTDLTISLHP
ncbi:MAG: hypothetical protein HC822_17490 [Oscillochloris sp.]|nr:hypothetical protein [Oscillochloris sp.]